ncbi:MAG: glycine/sarcosine/betaine reductase component B subunit [Solidesulfovibrio sp.]
MGLGPSTKETTLHYYRDPLVEHLAEDAEVDLVGIMVLGTSDSLDHKKLVANRVGVWAEAMNLNGAIVSIDSWGNCHIDFAQVMEAMGKRRIPLVGLSFVGNQAAFVVKNSYMSAIIDLNKTAEGVESLVLGQNTATEQDARKAVAILKHKIRKKFASDSWEASRVREKRRLIRRTFEAREVCLDAATCLENGVLRICPPDVAAIAAAYPEVRGLELRVIPRERRRQRVNAVLDFAPLAAKHAGEPGEGITNIFEGLIVMLTACEEGGFQPVNCGAAYGNLNEIVAFGRRGTPAPEDCILHVHVLLANGQGRTRAGIRAAHSACEKAVAPLRELLRGLGSRGAVRREELWDLQRVGGMRIALVKLVPGLGCLYDTVVLPPEPCASLEGTSIMDMGNMPLLLSPNEVRDGMLHSLA